MRLIDARTVREQGVSVILALEFHSSWDPRMKPYIYTKKDGRYILDLVQTAERLKQACTFLVRAGYEGKNILFIGTTEASSKIIKSKAIKAKAHYVNHRWIGGMLTNQSTMLKCIKRFRLSQKNYGKLSKKEESILMKKRKNLNIVFGGIQDMQTCPDIVVFVGQPSDKSNPLKECRNLGITTIALVDTNCNPEFADLPIPANDDSISSIELILDALSTSIATGQRMKVKGTCAPRSFQEQNLLPQDLSQIVETPSISELKVPSALAETLKDLNIETIDQLCRYDKNKLLKLKTINPSKYNLIKRAIIQLSSR